METEHKMDQSRYAITQDGAKHISCTSNGHTSNSTCWDPPRKTVESEILTVMHNGNLHLYILSQVLQTT